MVRPDYGAVDHVGTGIPLDGSGEGLQHGFGHARHGLAMIGDQRDDESFGVLVLGKLELCVTECPYRVVGLAAR